MTATRSMSDKICVVTGASSGIGLATAHGLARLGARVILAVRNLERGAAARREIVRASGNAAIEARLVDVSDQAMVRVFARDLARDLERVDVLVNNAGVWLERRELSVDGIERTWATNVLGYHLVTRELDGLLGAAPAARVVNVASAFAGRLDLDDVQFARRRYDAASAYMQSKQADRMLTWALARRWRGTTRTTNAMHPGTVATHLLGASFPGMGGRSPEQGADTVVWLASSDAAAGRSGGWWIDRRERECEFRDEEREEALWRLCEEMTGRD